uniref:BTB domain-containing protein n=1 Tax=Naja naja TaxID=35670 RepID=A0A8C7E5V6_NAJNA
MASGEAPLGEREVAGGQSLSSDTYLPKLLEGLQNLRSQNALCDVVLEAEGASFPAHRAILAVASSYCKTRFASEAAGRATSLKLAPPVTARGLQGVLSFLYSNRLELTLQTVEEVFRAAEALLVREVMCLSFRFLEGALDRHTCLPILRLAGRLGPEGLRLKVQCWVSKHCGHLLKDPAQLKELDRATLCKMLDRGDTWGLSELQLFQVAICWLEHNGSRQEDAAEVLGHVRFPSISLPDLQKFVQETPVMRTEPACRRYLQEALDYHGQPYVQPLLQSEGSRVRHRNEVLMVLGGRSVDNAICGDVWAADQHCHSWMAIGKLSGPLYNHCVAVLRDFVFVMGGQESADLSLFPLQVFRFDPCRNTWLQLASMLVPRTRFYAGALNERLVAVGGGAPLGMPTDTAEEYRLAKNAWRLLPAFPVPVADHAGATHGGILYISGGEGSLLGKDLTHSQLQLYVTGGGSLRRRSKEDGVWVCHPSRGTWVKVGCLPRTLADHACCSVHLPPGIASLGEAESEGSSDGGGK